MPLNKCSFGESNYNPMEKYRKYLQKIGGGEYADKKVGKYEKRAKREAEARAYDVKPRTVMQKLQSKIPNVSKWKDKEIERAKQKLDKQQNELFELALQDPNEIQRLIKTQSSSLERLAEALGQEILKEQGNLENYCQNLMRVNPFFALQYDSCRQLLNKKMGIETFYDDLEQAREEKQFDKLLRTALGASILQSLFPQNNQLSQFFQQRLQRKPYKVTDPYQSFIGGPTKYPLGLIKDQLKYPTASTSSVPSLPASSSGTPGTSETSTDVIDVDFGKVKRKSRTKSKRNLRTKLNRKSKNRRNRQSRSRKMGSTKRKSKIKKNKKRITKNNSLRKSPKKSRRRRRNLKHTRNFGYRAKDAGAFTKDLFNTVARGQPLTPVQMQFTDFIYNQ